MSLFFPGRQRTRVRDVGPDICAGQQRVATIRTPRGVPAPDREGHRYQEWVALQPLWLIVTFALPWSALAIYGCVPAALAIVWAWRRRWLCSPTSLGLAAFPGVFITAWALDVQPANLLLGNMMFHKIIVSLGMILVYFTKLAINAVNELRIRAEAIARGLIDLFAEALLEKMKDRPSSMLGGGREPVSRLRQSDP